MFAGDGLKQCFKLRKIAAWIMRYDLSDIEWSVIEPLLPTELRSNPKNNQRIVNGMFYNGMFYIVRGGCSWRERPTLRAPHHCLQVLMGSRPRLRRTSTAGRSPDLACGRYYLHPGLARRA
jgi:transposase